MHEVGVVDEMVHALLHRLDDMSSGQVVLKVFVKLGRESHLTDETFSMLFESMAKDTRLEGVAIEVEPVDGKAVTIDTLEVE